MKTKENRERGPRPATLLKRDSNTCVFLWILLSSYEHLFLKNSSVRVLLHIQDKERLADELQKYPCFDEKGNNGYKKRPGRKCLDCWSSWAVFNSIFMNNTFFFTTFAKKFIIQIIWNMILYHWHVSPAISYCKLLFLFFFLFPTSFSLFFWFAPDISLRENNKTLTAPLYLMDPF